MPTTESGGCAACATGWRQFKDLGAAQCCVRRSQTPGRWWGKPDTRPLVGKAQSPSPNHRPCTTCISMALNQHTCWHTDPAHIQHTQTQHTDTAHSTQHTAHRHSTQHTAHRHSTQHTDTANSTPTQHTLTSQQSWPSARQSPLSSPGSRQRSAGSSGRPSKTRGGIGRQARDCGSQHGSRHRFHGSPERVDT